MQRRQFLRLMASASLLPAGLSGVAKAADAPKEFRIGLQKNGVILIARQQKLIEAALEPLGIKVSWHEFQYGPPLLEALNAGAIDYGTTGDAPPIFAQAAAANLYYVAALPSGGAENAIIVPERSSIQTLSDLKGQKIGVGKGSSAHSLLLAALEKARLSYSNVKPVYLLPADANAAFVRGDIQAWSIWDPFYAIAESQQPTRTLATSSDTYAATSYYLANKSFTDQYPKIISLANDVLAKATEWGRTHQDEAAQLYANATGVTLAAQRKTVSRMQFVFTPITEEIATRQQATADRYHRLGLLPKSITVRDIVWKWVPNA